MSKSLGNVADPLDAIEKWGPDIVRFYLMRVGNTITKVDRLQTGPLLSSTSTTEKYNYFLRITPRGMWTRLSEVGKLQWTVVFLNL